MRWLVVLVISATLAGCVSQDSSTSTSEPPVAPAPPPGTHVFGGNATGTPTPSNLQFGTTNYTLVGHAGAEPTIGITSDGSIFALSGSVVYRSRDNGTTWSPVHTHLLLNSDPMMWVDPWTDRVFNAPMFPTLLCSTLYWSDDFGDTWTANPDVACGKGPFDHQKFATGPPGPDANPLAGALYPTVAYLCYNAVATTNCMMSYDGGLTWPVDRNTQVNLAPKQESVDLFTGCGSGQNGHPTAAPDGTIVFARNGPGCPQPFLTVSRDSGLTWSLVAGPQTPNPKALDPEVAFTPDGTLYMLYQDAQFHQLLARSSDMGQSWDGPWDVTPPGMNTTSFQALATGSDGRIAMSFLGAPAGGSPSSVPEDTRWHLFILTSDDAASDNPTFVSYQVTPETDPVQVGCVFQGGGSNPCRNLLDFIDGAVSPAGEFYVAYTEGCISDACKEAGSKGDTSRARETAVAWLRGWSLYAPGEGRPALLN